MASSNDGDFVFTWPCHAYLIEPGPRPGYFRDRSTGEILVAIWTDFDNFDSYMNRAGLVGKVAVLNFENKLELAHYLRSTSNDAAKVMIDPMAKVAGHVSRVFDKTKLIEWGMATRR